MDPPPRSILKEIEMTVGKRKKPAMTASLTASPKVIFTNPSSSTYDNGTTITGITTCTGNVRLLVFDNNNVPLVDTTVVPTGSVRNWQYPLTLTPGTYELPLRFYAYCSGDHASSAASVTVSTISDSVVTPPHHPPSRKAKK